METVGISNLAEFFILNKEHEKFILGETPLQFEATQIKSTLGFGVPIFMGLFFTSFVFVIVGMFLHDIRKDSLLSSYGEKIVVYITNCQMVNMKGDRRPE